MNLLTANPNLKAIFASNDEMALGASVNAGVELTTRDNLDQWSQ